MRASEETLNGLDFPSLWQVEPLVQSETIPKGCKKKKIAPMVVPGEIASFFRIEKH
jgi:hypothetical protein